MSDFQRISLDLSGLFLFMVGFVLAVHFRSYGLIACFLFFGTCGFFASLMTFGLDMRGFVVAAQWAYWACALSATSAAIAFIALFVQAVA